MQYKKQIILTLAVLTIATLHRPVFARIDDTEFETLVQNEVNKDSSLGHLNAQIETKAKSVKDLQERLYAFQQNINEKDKEQKDLKNHLAVLDDQIATTQTDIEKKGIEVEQLQLEIEVLQEQIRLAESDIQKTKGELRDVIRDIYNYEQKTPLEITLGSNTLADFFNNAEYTEHLQQSAQKLLTHTQEVKKQLEDKRTEEKNKKAEVAKQKTDLEVDQQTLEAQQGNQQALLDDSEASEAKFQTLADTVKKEEAAVNGQILGLQSSAQEKINSIRTEIEKRLQDDDTSNDTLTNEEQEIQNGKVTFAWPLEGKNASNVSCGFHCPGYPFPFEHAAIDIPTYVGTPVHAAISGYVTRSVWPGDNNLAWVLISGNDGYSTSYLHLSKIIVSVDQYVFQGDLIGYSGGMPNTPGAGAYTTGPHLHFEVAINGIKVDPLAYLP